MGYGERNAWIGLITGVASITAYVVLIAGQLTTRPVGEVDWAAPMLWTVGGAVALTIILTIVWSTIERGRNDDDRPVEDVRDRDISHLGSRVGQAFLVLGVVGALVLCGIRADWFWIANTLYVGAALSALIDGVTRVVVYRTGMP